MHLDSDDIRGLLRGTGIAASAGAIGLFVSSFASEGGMRKDKASGVVYFVDDQPPDSSRASAAWVATCASALLVTASVLVRKRPNRVAGSD